MNEPAVQEAIRHLATAQLVIEESADQYTFRHALTREAVYTSLLRRERKRWHNLVAQTIEQLYADALDANVGSLAYHYYEAETWERALHYARQAGERAQALYAPREAIAQFTRAIQSAEHLGASTASLRHARGQALELIGEFDQARADYETALEEARRRADLHGEWQALMDLGFLSASRHYGQTGEYLARALALARTSGDPHLLAHSLNRVGNWHANLDQQEAAARHHREALEIFERLNDRPGIAETLDLLGMTTMLDGDSVGARKSYERAIAIFRELDDRQGLSSTLASMPLLAQRWMGSSSVSGVAFAGALEAVETALKIAREIGWRAGEAYGLVMLAGCHSAQGNLRPGLDAAKRALEIAKEISHQQWLTAAHSVSGSLELELFRLAKARRHLEQSVAMANEIGSAIWIGAASSLLASAYVTSAIAEAAAEPGAERSRQRRADAWLERADSLLSRVLKPGTPCRTQSQRLCWCARAEWALAAGQAGSALAIVDRLLAAAPNLGPGVVIPRLSRLRGQALVQLRRYDEAEITLRAVQAAASAHGLRPMLWRVHLLLAQVYEALGQSERAEAELASMRAVVDDLATGLPAGMADLFLQSVGAMSRGAPMSSPRRTETKQLGLTRREREVAALVAQGKSNREIAQALDIAERTVETHVGNILSKLGFSTRTSIAVWMVQQNPESGQMTKGADLTR